MAQVTYFTSKSRSQFLRVQGDRVRIICIMDFNPSVEETHYDEKLVTALECTPCTEQEFKEASMLALHKIFPAVLAFTPMPAASL